VDVERLLQQGKRLIYLRGMVDPGFHPDHFSIWLPEKIESDRASVVFCPAVDLGSVILIAAGAWQGRPELEADGNGYRVGICNPALTRFKRRVLAKSEWKEDIITELVDDAVKTLESANEPAIITADPPMHLLPPGGDPKPS
jgi:hypothetical protein